ncbi:MAG: alkaline phosphatase family protein [Bryobacterales bacterium]|nr:alkaline phosphatase family protein [Bryobacteraceae bacterium]MDW8129114.1 alkaline phosphatase family protein [Bryobacterales bacterium]
MPRKLLLVGWDGADWRFINPLLDEGLMPALGGLVKEGVIGNLAGIQPLLSPLLWTSIATGMLPDKHGVLGFLEPDPVSGGVRPVSSTTRKVKALWNILMQEGYRAHVVAWLAGHPAEPLNGVAISPAFAHARAPYGQPWHLPAGSVHPERLRETFAGLRIHPGELGEAELLPFIPKAAEVDQEKDPRLAIFAITLAQCLSVHNAVTWILEHEPWDFVAVYYEAIDHFSHAFAAYHPPKADWVPEKDFEIYREVMTGVYRFHDMMLERLLDLAGPEATVMLVSDHGFHSGPHRPRRMPQRVTGPVVWHRPFGVFCLKGPGIRRDERIYGATVLDVTPTALALFELPVGEDMDGKVLLPAFEAPSRVRTIPSWERVPGECGMHPAEMRMDPEAARALIEQFVALGYVEPAQEQSQIVSLALREWQFNLAQVYLSTRRPSLALPLLEGLRTQWPEEASIGVALAQCHLVLNQREKARAVVEDLLSRDEHRPWARWLLAALDLGEERTEQALEELVRIEEDSVRMPALLVRLGAAYLRLGRLEDAERVFREAMASEPDLPSAYLGLATVCLRERRYSEAAEAALEAVGLQHLLPAGHFLLGIALARLRQYDRAVLAFETALRMEPALAPAHRWLATLYGRRGGDPAKAAWHWARWAHLRRQRAAVRDAMGSAGM